MEEQFRCLKCGKTKKSDSKNYYKSFDKDNALGIIPYCKECLNEMVILENGLVDENKLKDTLKLINRPFIKIAWEASKIDDKYSFGAYMKNLAMKQYRELKWEDSDHLKEDMTPTPISSNTINSNGYDLEELKEKYGYGYPDDEYYLFEKKYQQLRPSVKILTTMHDEFFREYCVDKVKETLAKAKGEFKEAKEWATMAKDAATAGKLNPNQMSKSDLSGGMDTFGQLVRMVEETPKGELLGLLPKFIERPKDKVDVILWCYVNYVRDLKGLPECEYKEIYDFYEKRRESYESQMIDQESGDEDG